MNSVIIDRDAARHCAVAALFLTVGLAIAKVGWPAVAGSLGAFVVVAVAVLAGFADVATTRGFGLANAVTLARVTMVCFLVALVPRMPERLDLAFGVAAASFLLDCVDGALARRRGEVSRFGARFDMESDALTVLVLSVLVAAADRAGLWVVALGLMRYGFGAASLKWPILVRPAPGERRRKAICAFVVGALVAALGPLSPAVTSGLCLAALGLLIYSFGTDVAFQLRTARMAARVPPAPSDALG